jgi:hypothetical protein
MATAIPVISIPTSAVEDTSAGLPSLIEIPLEDLDDVAGGICLLYDVRPGDRNGQAEGAGGQGFIEENWVCRPPTRKDGWVFLTSVILVTDVPEA